MSKKDEAIKLIDTLFRLSKNAKMKHFAGNLTEEYVNINQKRVLNVLSKLEGYNLNELRYYDYLLDKLKAANPEFKPEKPKEEPPANPMAKLKTMPKKKVDLALKQLSDSGIDAAKMNDLFEKAIQTSLRRSVTPVPGMPTAPQKLVDDFKNNDLVIMKKIQSQVVDILSGDFNSLKESKRKNILIYAGTYRILNEVLKKAV